MSLPCAKTLTFYSKINCVGFWKGANHGKQGTEGEEQGKKEEKEREAKAAKKVARDVASRKVKIIFSVPQISFLTWGMCLLLFQSTLSVKRATAIYGYKLFFDPRYCHYYYFKGQMNFKSR